MNHNDFHDLLSRYSLHEVPFTREIAVKNRFLHEHQNQQLEYLKRAVDKKMSATLIAPAGTGKTMLLRTLVDCLPETRYRVHYVKVTSLSKRDLCREIAVIVGVKPAGNYPTLVRRMQERFTSSYDTDSVKSVNLDSIQIKKNFLIRLSLTGILTLFWLKYDYRKIVILIPII